MTRPGQLKQPVQLLEQQRATACFIGEGFPLRAADLPLNAILMKSFVQGIETRPKIQPMEGIGIGASRSSLSNSRQGFAERISTYFRPSLTLNDSAWAQSALNCSASFNERLAVIGKGQRHEPAAGQPAAHGTK